MFREMNETEIEIAQIDRLRMVHFYELTGVKTGDSEESGGNEANSRGAMAVAVYYGEKEQINLSELDPYFTELTLRVMNLYRESPNRDSILMDETTRRFLENGIRTKEELWGAFYEKEALAYPEIPVEASMSRVFAGMIEYLLIGLYKVNGQELSIDTREHGWRGATLLRGILNHKKEQFYFRVHKTDPDRYTILVSPFIRDFVSLTVNVQFEPDALNVIYRAEGMDYYGEMIYRMGDASYRESHVTYYNGNTIFYENETHPYAVEQVPEKLVRLVPELTGNLIGVTFPWGTGWYRRTIATTDKNIEARRSEGIIYSPEANLCELRGWTELRNTDNGIRVRTRAEHVVRMTLSKGRMQTYFVKRESNVGGKYRQHLEGKYYIE